MRKRTWLRSFGFVVAALVVSGTVSGTVLAAGDGEQGKTTGDAVRAVSFEVARPDGKHDQRGIMYTYPDRKRVLLWGDLQFRDNNPGCLRYNDDRPAKAAGALGRDGQGFAVFPDYHTGERASDAWWDRAAKDGLTIAQAVDRLSGDDAGGSAKGSPPNPAPASVGTSDEGYVLVSSLRLQEAFKTTEDLHASSYEFRPNGGDGPAGPPARLCFAGPDINDRVCFEAETEIDNGHHGYNSVSKLSIVPIFKDRQPGYAVLFAAGGCAYGRDLGNFITLWAPGDKGRRSPNVIFAAKYRTLLGAFALLSAIRPNMQGLVATAKYVPAKGEGDYNPHRYKIELFRYSDKSGMFEPAGDFVTKEKYNDATVERIFESEMKGIEKLLRKK